MTKKTKKIVWITPVLLLTVLFFAKNARADTDPASSVWDTIATLNADEFSCNNPNTGEPNPITYWFEYGTDANLVTFTSTPPNTVVGSGPTTYYPPCDYWGYALSESADITGLQPNTKYYFRVNHNGSILNFTTLPTQFSFTVSPSVAYLPTNGTANYYNYLLTAFNITPSVVGCTNDIVKRMLYYSNFNTSLYGIVAGNPAGVLNAGAASDAETCATPFGYIQPGYSVFFPASAGTYSIPITGRYTNTSGVSFFASTTVTLIIENPTFNLTCANSCGFVGVVNGANPPNQILTINNTGNSSISWTASKTQSWLTRSPTTGTTLANGTSNITVSVNTSALAVGAYNDTITVISGGITKTIPVNLTVTGTTLYILKSTWEIYGPNNPSLLATSSTWSGKANFPSTVFPDGNYVATLKILDSFGLTSSIQKNFSVGSSAAVNGLCGSAAPPPTNSKVYPYTATSYGSDTFCSAGAANPASPGFPAQGSSVSWICMGQNGGSSPSCTASRSNPSGTYSITVNKTVGGYVTSAPIGINCGSDCAENYSSGTSVVLTAHPNPIYWKFVGWSGDCTGGNMNCSITVNGSKIVTATFIPQPFQYTEF